MQYLKNIFKYFMKEEKKILAAVSKVWKNTVDEKIFFFFCNYFTYYNIDKNKK